MTNYYKLCPVCIYFTDEKGCSMYCDPHDTDCVPFTKKNEPFVKAQKFDGGKVPLDLVPANALLEVAKGFQYGQKKYGRFNYLKPGFSHHQLCAAALRHINAHLRNEDIDAESQNSHLSHACAALMMLIENIKRNNIEDDRYKE